MTDNQNYIDQRKQQEIESQKRDNLRWLYPAAAGLGAIALGAYITKSFKGQGGNVMADMLHFLGRPRGVAVNVDQVANAANPPASGASGIRSWLTSTFNVSRQQVQLGPIDLIKDLAGAMQVIGNAGTPIRETVRQKVTEAVHRKFSNYGNNTSFFSQNLQRITVDEVLGNKEKWSPLIGQHQFNVLSSASERGLVHGTQGLDKNIFKTSKGYLRDTRVRNIFMKVGDDGESLVPKVDLFGQFNVFKSLS